jgi:hypothetical protein
MTKRAFLQKLLCSPLKGMRASPSVGLERLVRYTLILLRAASLQYWLLALIPDDDAMQRRRRDIAVDVSVVGQCIAVVLSWWLVPARWLDSASAVVAYLLFCLYLSLLNIVFFSGVPSVNKPTTSATRSILLLAVNVVHVTFTFALFYRARLNLSPRAALFGSFMVLGTLGIPDGAVTANTVLVPLQILSDFLLLAFAVAVFVGQVPMRFSNGGRGGTSGTA